MEKIHIGIPVIVEGKYDSEKLSHIIDANIIKTDGFAVFNSSEKQQLIRTLAANGIIVLTDSDGAGRVIRSKISSIVSDRPIYPLYIPRIRGTEKRKSRPSKEGLLGVEGIEEEKLRNMFTELAEKLQKEGIGSNSSADEPATKEDLFEDGLTGGMNSSFLRDKVASCYGLPSGMTTNSFLAALNMLGGKKRYKNIVSSINKDEAQ